MSKSKLRLHREELRMTMSKVSQGAGVNATTLCLTELGKLVPSPKFRAALAAFYGKPEAALFYETGFAR